MCASEQIIVINTPKKRKLQCVSLADSDKLSASIGPENFADSLGLNRWQSDSEARASDCKQTLGQSHAKCTDAYNISSFKVLANP